MSLHKLSAGRGYDYLIRQVAALDATHRGRSDLASYYAERGETPGRWLGRGIAGIDGLEVGDVVTGEQMRLLFAEGRHPLADQASPGGPELLGVPFRSVEGVERPFRQELRARYAAHAKSLGLSRRAALPGEVRARIRTDLAREWFREVEGRDPKGDLELTSAVTRWSRPMPAPVGGYDLTFSPVKSVSALWALAEPRCTPCSAAADTPTTSTSPALTLPTWSTTAPSSSACTSRPPTRRCTASSSAATCRSPPPPLAPTSDRRRVENDSSCDQLSDLTTRPARTVDPGRRHPGGKGRFLRPRLSAGARRGQGRSDVGCSTLTAPPRRQHRWPRRNRRSLSTNSLNGQPVSLDIAVSGSSSIKGRAPPGRRRVSWLRYGPRRTTACLTLILSSAVPMGVWVLSSGSRAPIGRLTAARRTVRPLRPLLRGSASSTPCSWCDSHRRPALSAFPPGWLLALTWPAPAPRH